MGIRLADGKHIFSFVTCHRLSRDEALAARHAQMVIAHDAPHHNRFPESCGARHDLRSSLANMTR